MPLWVVPYRYCIVGVKDAALADHSTWKVISYSPTMIMMAGSPSLDIKPASDVISVRSSTLGVAG